MLAFDRRFVLIPMVLVIVVLSTAFVVANEAQTRLTQSTDRVQEVERRQAMLSNFMQMMLNAETGQRGFLITGTDTFLEPYRAAVSQRERTLQALRAAYGGNHAFDAYIEQITAMVQSRFEQLQHSLTLQSQDATLAADYIRSQVGRQTMEKIRTAAEQLRQMDAAALAATETMERRDLIAIRRVTVTAAALDLVLVITACVMISRSHRRRVLDAQRMHETNEQLEAEVASRTSALALLSTRLQEVTERETGLLARELHDELGGLLIAAKMDVNWLRRHLAEDSASELRWERVDAVLNSGVDLKRRIVEQLRPSLLDNMGLNTALRWQFYESCQRAGLNCTDDMPTEELALHADASIAIFRVAQEAMTNILKHAHASTAHLSVKVDAEALTMVVRDDGIGLAAPRPDRRTHGLLSMRHRVEALGGKWEIDSGPQHRGTEIRVRLPLAKIRLTTP